MSDDNQILIPPSFIALFVPPGKIKPGESRAVIAERYELCEDLALMLTETARAQFFALHITEADVLDRVRAGLLDGNAIVSAPEAGWVVTRLAELLDWPDAAPAG